MPAEILLPADGWCPRPYQLPAWTALERGVKRVALMWHRRAGKDELCLHWAACAAMTRVGNYVHMLPQANQARRAIWEAVNPHTGRRRLDEAFPRELRAATRDADMLIRFRNGSLWQVVGSDNYRSLIGSPPRGVIFSEYALADPDAWAFLRPILAENGGWAAFISTPRGRNHFSRLCDHAATDPAWFHQRLTVADTGVIAPAAIAQERRELAAERGELEARALIDQEYYCDVDAALPGAYYGEPMKRADAEGRIGVFPWLPSLPVGTAWDLGHGDSTVILFYQQPPGGRLRVIDVYEASGVGLDHYARLLAGRPYVYADHLWPHDGGHGNIRDIAGNTLSRTAQDLGIRPLRILPRDPSLEHGISAVRQLLPLCEFNTEPLPLAAGLDGRGEAEDPGRARARMGRALDALRQYRRAWDDKRGAFRDAPLHDWTSHTADALRYLARGRRPFEGRRQAFDPARLRADGPRPAGSFLAN